MTRGTEALQNAQEQCDSGANLPICPADVSYISAVLFPEFRGFRAFTIAFDAMTWLLKTVPPLTFGNLAFGCIVSSPWLSSWLTSRRISEMSRLVNTVVEASTKGCGWEHS